VAEEINKNTTAGKKIQQMHSEAITLSGLRLLGLTAHKVSLDPADFSGSSCKVVHF
jgi:hypothetical protein